MVSRTGGMGMTKRLLMGSALIIGLAGCATPAWHAEPYRDLSCVAMADVSLAEAIEAAEETHGLRVIDAEYNMETEMGCLRGDPGHFDVTFFQNGKLSRAIVEADSGEVGPG